MMFRKWMIVACVAVAAAMGSAAAQAQYSYTHVELKVKTRLHNALGRICMTEKVYVTPLQKLCTSKPVAPYSETTVTLPVDSAEGENYHIEVKVRNRPAKVLKIKRSDVLKLMQKSGFTSGVHPTVSAVVDKYGKVSFGRVYLKKDVAP